MLPGVGFKDQAGKLQTTAGDCQIPQVIDEGIRVSEIGHRASARSLKTLVDRGEHGRRGWVSQFHGKPQDLGNRSIVQFLVQMGRHMLGHRRQGAGQVGHQEVLAAGQPAVGNSVVVVPAHNRVENPVLAHFLMSQPAPHREGGAAGNGIQVAQGLQQGNPVWQGEVLVALEQPGQGGRQTVPFHGPVHPLAGPTGTPPGGGRRALHRVKDGEQRLAHSLVAVVVQGHD